MGVAVCSISLRMSACAWSRTWSFPSPRRSTNAGTTERRGGKERGQKEGDLLLRFNLRSMYEVILFCVHCVVCVLREEWGYMCGGAVLLAKQAVSLVKWKGGEPKQLREWHSSKDYVILRVLSHCSIPLSNWGSCDLNVLLSDCCRRDKPRDAGWHNTDCADSVAKQ